MGIGTYLVIRVVTVCCVAVLIPIFRTSFFRGFICLICFVALILGVFVLTPSFMGAPNRTANSQIGTLTDKIAKQRDAISELEGSLSQASSALATQYKELTARRQALKTEDTSAVEKFNEENAAYKTANDQARELSRRLETARQELDALLDQRSKQMAVAKPAANTNAGVSASAQKKVVVYSTSRCPYCVQAKQYLARKGIAYQEVNVESSRSAAEEFQRLGGGGVPLILIGNKRIQGFSAEEIDEALQ